MGYTGPRTNASVLNYHIGRFNELFTLENDVWVYHSELVDAKMTADLGDMLGGLNSSYRAQYGNTPFPTDPNSGGATQPQPPASGPDWPLDMQPEMWGGNRRSGDDGVPYADPRKVTCVPITIPAGGYHHNPFLTMSVAEYRSPPSTKQAVLSRIAGDFTSPMAFSEGNTAAPTIQIGVHVQPGEQVFFCWRYYSRDLNDGKGGPSTDEQQQGVTYGGGWPS